MGQYPPNITFRLLVYLPGRSDKIEIKLREPEWQRFRNNTVNVDEDRKLNFFFVCDTIDGKSIGLSIGKIQAVNILEDVSIYVEDSTVHQGPIRMLLLGRDAFVEVESTAYPEEFYDFFNCLEHGPDFAGPFLGFPDEDNEEVVVNIEELLYIEAPQQLVNEGCKLWRKSIGMED